MDPETFCPPCEFRSSGKKVCIWEEFYPPRGYCPGAIVGGMPAQLDCTYIHLERGVTIRRDEPELEQKVLALSKERADEFSAEISSFFSRPTDIINPPFHTHQLRT